MKYMHHEISLQIKVLNVEIPNVEMLHGIASKCNDPSGLACIKQIKHICHVVSS